MYRQLSEHPTDEEIRKYYEQLHKEAEEIMREVWSLRGWTVKWDWHNGICDDCEFLYDETGKCLGVKWDAIPRSSSIADRLDSLKLSVSHTKKSVKISNRHADKPVEGKGRTITLAYINWLLAIEKQKAEEKKCAVT